MSKAKPGQVITVMTSAPTRPERTLTGIPRKTLEHVADWLESAYPEVKASAAAMATEAERLTTAEKAGQAEAARLLRRYIAAKNLYSEEEP